MDVIGGGDGVMDVDENLKLSKTALEILDYLIKKVEKTKVPRFSKVELWHALNKSLRTIERALYELRLAELIALNNMKGYYVIIDLPRAKRIVLRYSKTEVEGGEEQ